MTACQWVIDHAQLLGGIGLGVSAVGLAVAWAWMGPKRHGKNRP